MRTPQSKVEKYLQRFSGWLLLYPQSFRDAHGEEMLQTLRDQLDEALEEGQPLRDIYYANLTELPGSLMQAHIRDARSIPHNVTKNPSGLWFIVFLLLTEYAFLGANLSGNTSAEVFIIFVALCIFGIYGLRITRNLFLACIAPAFILISGFILSSLSPFSVFLSQILPLCFGFFGLALAFLFAHKLRKHRKVRPFYKYVRLITRTLLGIFIVANCFALYDPPFPEDERNLVDSIPQINASDNAWYTIESTPDITPALDTYKNFLSVTPDHFVEVLDDLQKNNQLQSLLDATTETRAAGHAILTKKEYREPEIHGLVDTSDGSIFLEKYHQGQSYSMFRPLLAEAYQDMVSGNVPAAESAVTAVTHLARLRLQSGTQTFFTSYLLKDIASVVGKYPELKPSIQKELPTDQDVRSAMQFYAQISTALVYKASQDDNWRQAAIIVNAPATFLPYFAQRNKTLHGLYMSYVENAQQLASANCNDSSVSKYPDFPEYSQGFPTISELFHTNSMGNLFIKNAVLYQNTTNLYVMCSTMNLVHNLQIN